MCPASQRCARIINHAKYHQTDSWPQFRLGFPFYFGKKSWAKVYWRLKDKPLPHQITETPKVKGQHTVSASSSPVSRSEADEPPTILLKHRNSIGLCSSLRIEIVFGVTSRAGRFSVGWGGWCIGGGSNCKPIRLLMLLSKLIVILIRNKMSDLLNPRLPSNSKYVWKRSGSPSSVTRLLSGSFKWFWTLSLEIMKCICYVLSI